MAGHVDWDEGAMRTLFHSADGDVAKAITKATVQVEGGAKRRAAVDTGRMRASINHEVRAEGDDIVGRVGTDVDYAIHVELGTRHMAAQPFLRPALDDAKL